MRILMIYLVFLCVQPAAAITKCVLNGKVTYKNGVCPINSTTQFLVKDRYVDKSQLQKARRKSDVQAEKAFIRINIRPQYDENGTLIRTVEQVINAKEENESVDTQVQQADQRELWSDEREESGVDSDANARLLEMQRQLDQSKKELQQLQQQSK